MTRFPLFRLGGIRASILAFVFLNSSARDIVHGADCEAPNIYREIQNPRPGFPGSHDPTFHPLQMGDSGDGWVEDVRVQPDGKLLILGGFVIEQVWRSGLVRLHPDGKLDPGFGGEKTRFGAQGLRPIGNVMALQADGRVLLASPDWFGRLRADGSEDPEFSSPFLPGEELRRRSGDEAVLSLALQPDRRILAGGTFHSVGGLPMAGVIRLNPDGTVDRTFIPDPLFLRENIYVARILLQPDGRLLLMTDVGCIGLTSEGALERAYMDLNLRSRSMTAALTADGTPLVSAPGYRSRLERWDGYFHPDLHVEIGSSDECSGIDAIASLPDGKILVGGKFTRIGVAERLGIARLHPDGALDLSFFASVGNRLFDESFYPRGVTGFALEQNSSLLIFGDFSQVNGSGPPLLARLNNGEWTGIAPFSIRQLPDGSVQFQVTGRVGQEVVLEAASSLKSPNWVPIRTNLIVSGGNPITLNGDRLSRQFYRARAR